MTNVEGRRPEGAPERSPKAGEGAASGVDGKVAKRFSVQRKMAVVARLLRGEPLELVARETNVSIARLSEWRERALAGAATCDWDKPNCRAILDGVTPALKAACTAFICPRVSGVAAVLDGRCLVGLLVGRACFGFGSTEPGSIFVGASRLSGSLPRRLGSSVAARSSRSRSPLLRYLMAVGKSLGRVGRGRGPFLFRSVASLVEEKPIPEKRSGDSFSTRLRPITLILPPPSSRRNFDFEASLGRVRYSRLKSFPE
jgi:hypothetical protein